MLKLFSVIYYDYHLNFPMSYVTFQLLVDVLCFWWEQNSCSLEFVCLFGEAVKRAGEKVMLGFVGSDH